MADLILHESLSEIPAAEWDAVAAPEQAAGRPVDPFTTHRFLSALDLSGSTGKGSGWQARPLALREGGRLVAATPLYVKSHSQGEYIFDHGWADALERAGGRYYPKLQIAVPFTPATGRRFLGGRSIAKRCGRRPSGSRRRTGCPRCMRPSAQRRRPRRWPGWRARSTASPNSSIGRTGVTAASAISCPISPAASAR